MCVEYRALARCIVVIPALEPDGTRPQRRHPLWCAVHRRPPSPQRSPPIGRCIVVIPALEPDGTLADYAASLLERGAEQVVVVDDGGHLGPDPGLPLGYHGIAEPDHIHALLHGL